MWARVIFLRHKKWRKLTAVWFGQFLGSGNKNYPLLIWEYFCSEAGQLVLCLMDYCLRCGTVYFIGARRCCQWAVKYSLNIMSRALSPSIGYRSFPRQELWLHRWVKSATPFSAITPLRRDGFTGLLGRRYVTRWGRQDWDSAHLKLWSTFFRVNYGGTWGRTRQFGRHICIVNISKATILLWWL